MNALDLPRSLIKLLTYAARRAAAGAASPLLALISMGLSIPAQLSIAQPQNLRTPPHIGYVYPAGGQVGTTFTMVVGGQNLSGTNEAHISAPGVTATIVSYSRPMTQKEFNDLREKIQALQEKRAAALGLAAPKEDKPDGGTKRTHNPNTPPVAATPGTTPAAAAGTWTPEDQRQLAELRAMLAKRPNRQGNPAIAETVTLEVAIAPEAPCGPYEIRLRTPAGLSNPVRLEIGSLPEFVSPVVTATEAPPAREREAGTRGSRSPQSGSAVSLPVTINGQILPGEVDRYRFEGKVGQHVTMLVSARTLLPYLADAVPGWFQATLALFDASGRELAYSDGYEFSPDPVVSYALPRDGTYFIEIKDSIYRGREDFVYRIAVGELPFVTSVFPLAARTDARRELSGWNLPSTAEEVPDSGHAAARLLVAFESRGALSASARARLNAEAGQLEIEPNDAPEGAQEIALPTVIDGRIQHAGDRDLFRFIGKAGQPLVAEVYARRLGSPLDSTLKLSDAAGRQLAFNDDHEDKGAGLMTHQADSRLATTLPANGVYVLTIADRESHGGADYSYRLRVGLPDPDFELRIVPSSINLAAGGTVALTVYALRRDGFAGDVTVWLSDAPPGFVLAGGVIPGGEDYVRLTLTAPRTAAEGLTRLNLRGSSTAAGKKIVREAVPADDLMQAFAYHHLVPAQELLVDVVKRPATAIQAVTNHRVRVMPGSATSVTLRAFVPRAVENISAELDDGPAGITIKEVKLTGNQVEVVLWCDAAKAPLNQRGNLVLNLFGERINPNAGKARAPQRIPLGAAPAVPFEIVAGAE